MYISNFTKWKVGVQEYSQIHVKIFTDNISVVYNGVTPEVSYKKQELMKLTTSTSVQPGG
jgi:hypothetical protein